MHGITENYDLLVIWRARKTTVGIVLIQDLIKIAKLPIAINIKTQTEVPQ